VLIVDDDPAMAAFMADVVEAFFQIKVLRAETAQAARDLFRRHAGEIRAMLCDFSIGDEAGTRLVKEFCATRADLNVIFVTGHGDVPMAVEAMRHGAFDFLQKPFRDQDLIDRVQQALERDRETREDLREHSRIRARIATLTPREKEVLDLLTVGKANKMMAQDLGLSQRTVEIHRAHVMEKMGAKSVAQLVRMVMDLERSEPAART